MGFNSFGFGFGGIFMLLFWGLIIWAIFALVRGGMGHGCGGHGGSSHDSLKRDDSALDILKECYAKGDISKEEFEEKKKDLM